MFNIVQPKLFFFHTMAGGGVRLCMFAFDAAAVKE